MSSPSQRDKPAAAWYCTMPSSPTRSLIERSPSPTGPVRPDEDRLLAAAEHRLGGASVPELGARVHHHCPSTRDDAQLAVHHRLLRRAPGVPARARRRRRRRACRRARAARVGSPVAVDIAARLGQRRRRRRRLRRDQQREERDGEVRRSIARVIALATCARPTSTSSCPPDQIAQAPLPRRDDARLYVLDRATGARRAPPRARSAVAAAVGRAPRGQRHARHPGAPAATKPTGGARRAAARRAARRRRPRAHWRCLGGASKPIRPGPLTLDGERRARAEVLAVDGEYVEVALRRRRRSPTLERIGEVPLPPYIKRAAPDDRDDRERYQTVFARAPGAVAAPTAGLHFTPELLAALDAARHRARDRSRCTSAPAPSRRCAPTTLDDHDAARRALRDPRGHRARHRRDARRRRARSSPSAPPWCARSRPPPTARRHRARRAAATTQLFIRPGHRFRAVDALLTNFHLPRSTLLMLVAAFAGRERVLAAYADAVAARLPLLQLRRRHADRR